MFCRVCAAASASTSTGLKPVFSTDFSSPIGRSATMRVTWPVASASTVTEV
jgi:hypothetical protein